MQHNCWQMVIITYVPESNVVETKALFVSTNDLARRLQKLNNEQKFNPTV